MGRIPEVKWTIPILWLAALWTANAAMPAVRPYEDYQVILDRKPFGAPLDRSLEPERVVPVSESFAAQMVLSGVYELDDGNLRVAVTDKKNNSYFALMVGEKSDQGIELIDADYEAGEAILKKGSESVKLTMSGESGSAMLSTTELQDRVKQAEERRLSYAERRRQRMLERQKPVEIPKPTFTGEELEKHLQDYQMQVIREGLPPLPVQLTPDRDAQLVSEGYLPPVDDEGYEVDPDAEDEEYYEE